MNDGDRKQIAHNFWMKHIPDGAYTPTDLETLRTFIEWAEKEENSEPKKFKVALCFICLNEPYWQYISEAVEGAKKFFLPGHNVDYLLWSDLPYYKPAENVNYGCRIFPVESAPWPMPTLMRYHLMLPQEEVLREYDYVFYCDIDMRFVNVVGDEILGDGLTAAQHPMYAVRRELIPPYEPNPNSSAYIPRPGRVINEPSKPPKFESLYYAGGFQGGKTDKWIDAMKGMKKSIDDDFVKDYIAIWNDEAHWNKYLFENPPSVVLSPSYIYPDSLIDEYYVKVWGKNYPPKLVTITKKFTTSAEGGAQVADMIKTL